MGLYIFYDWEKKASTYWFILPWMTWYPCSSLDLKPLMTMSLLGPSSFSCNIFFWLRPRSITLLWHATVSPGDRFLIRTLAPFSISCHVIFCIVCCNRKIAICIHSNAKENFICIEILEEPLSLVSFYVIDSINTINFARCSCVFKAIAAAAKDWLCILDELWFSLSCCWW